MFVVCGKKCEVMISEVMCDRSSLMANEVSSSPEVRIFVTEKEALWYKFKHSFSQQGSSSEGNFWVDVPSAKALPQTSTRPSGCVTETVDSKET